MIGIKLRQIISDGVGSDVEFDDVRIGTREEGVPSGNLIAGPTFVVQVGGRRRIQES
jgi:hypothetical protein